MPAVPEVQEPVAVTVQASEQASPAHTGDAASRALSPWRISVLAGAALLFIAFVIPWWGMKSQPPSEFTQDSARDMKALDRVAKDNRDWYEDHLDKRQMEKMKDPEKYSIKIWGWSTGAGVSGMIVGLLICASIFMPIFLPMLRPWRWTGSLATAFLGLIVLILATVWVFGSPGECVGRVLSQGISVGPVLSLLAVLLILTGAIKEGVSGLTLFCKGRKANALAPLTRPCQERPNPRSDRFAHPSPTNGVM
jgi:hypothetical protein